MMNKQHFIGAGVVFVAFLAVILPVIGHILAMRQKQASEKFLSHQVITLREFETVLGDAAVNIERGLYMKAYQMAKDASDKILHKEFSYNAFIKAGDLFFATEFTHDKQKYIDALYFYMLAQEQEKPFDNEQWRKYQIANCYVQLGYVPNAITEFTQFINDFPLSPYLINAKMFLAGLLIEKKKIDEAQQILLEIIDTADSDESMSEIVYQLAQLYLKRADLLPEVQKRNE